MSHDAYLSYVPQRACWEFVLTRNLPAVGMTAAYGPGIAKLGKIEWEAAARHGTMMTDDTVARMDEDELRSLMQAIVNEAYAKLGIAPTGFDAELGAQSRHLEDMRSLVFKSGKPSK